MVIPHRNGQAIDDVAAAMKITAQPATRDEPIMHSELFLLVDRAGHVVGIYHNTDVDDVNRLITDATELAKK